MKIIRKPIVNAAIISSVTAFYSFVFILTAGHTEFKRMLNHPNTLTNSFWNSWSAFLSQGNLKYIGYAYILMAVAVVIFSFIRKQDYDEYQTGILEKGLIIAALVFLVIMHWTTVLIADLIYVIKWEKS